MDTRIHSFHIYCLLLPACATAYCFPPAAPLAPATASCCLPVLLPPAAHLLLLWLLLLPPAACLCYCLLLPTCCSFGCCYCLLLSACATASCYCLLLPACACAFANIPSPCCHTTSFMPARNRGMGAHPCTMPSRGTLVQGCPAGAHSCDDAQRLLRGHTHA